MNCGNQVPTGFKKDNIKEIWPGRKSDQKQKTNNNKRKQIQIQILPWAIPWRKLPFPKQTPEILKISILICLDTWVLTFGQQNNYLFLSTEGKLSRWKRRKALLPDFVLYPQNAHVSSKMCHLYHIHQVLQDDSHLRWKKSNLKESFVLASTPAVNTTAYIWTRPIVVKYLLLNLKRLHWRSVSCPYFFSLLADRDVVFFRENVSDHGPWQINMNR